MAGRLSVQFTGEQGRPRLVMPAPIPHRLREWLVDSGAAAMVADVARIPGGHGSRPFVMATVRFSKLDFRNHEFNPRNPNPVKVNQLAASIRSLGLLSPLTCYYKGEKAEPVVLVDGRHRYNALKILASEDARWRNEASVDLKVYWQMPTSDVHVLATYLNRTRQNLRKGEYYRAVVRIYDEKRQELRDTLRREPTEERIFASVNARELSDRTFALSIGRLVALAGLQSDEWKPLVGEYQNQRIANSVPLQYCPLTAGNMATFLSYVCNPRPYADSGAARHREFASVLRLGTELRATILRPVANRDEATATTVGLKHWCLAALGAILADRLPHEGQQSAFGSPSLDWEMLAKVLRAYASIMSDQAALINRYKGGSDTSALKQAWSYQTQRDQVRAPLEKELAARGCFPRRASHRT